MADISIIIVTYNSMGFIKNCLQSIFSQTYKGFEIIIVDNNSKDNTIEFVKKEYPCISVIENKDNRGFSYACNQGIKISKGKYILILNSDVVLERNFLNEILNAVNETGHRIGMIAPKILSVKNHKIIDSTGIILSRARRFFDRGRGETDSGQYDYKSEVFGPSGAAALYKKEMLENICVSGECFDSDFFLLFEDIDVAWRAQNFGWKALYVPRAKCYHLRNISAMNTQYVQYLSFRNRYFLIIKNERWKNILKNILFILPYDFVRLFYFLIINKYALMALRELKMMLPKMYKKRQEILFKK